MSLTPKMSRLDWLSSILPIGIRSIHTDVHLTVPNNAVKVGQQIEPETTRYEGISMGNIQIRASIEPTRASSSMKKIYQQA